MRGGDSKGTEYFIRELIVLDTFHLLLEGKRCAEPDEVG